MSDIVISKKNETHLFIDCEPCILQELLPYFTFKVPGYQFMPAYKSKRWTGDISVLDVRFGLLPIGLYQTLVDVAKKLEYTVETKTSQFGIPGEVDNVTLEEVAEFAKSLNVHSKGNPIEIRDYQVQSVYNCIKAQRLICISPTGSGKSLIAYILFRWYLSKGKEHFLLVVPNLGLLRQMIGDFIDYSSHNEFDVVSNSQLIEGGTTKDITKSLIISTWQSIYKQPSTWLNKLDVILGDECFSGDTKVLTIDGWKSISHLANADVIYNINTDGEVKLDTVINVHKNLFSSSNNEMLKLTFDNNITVEVTSNHKFMLSSGAWKCAKDLTMEDDIKWQETKEVMMN